MALGIFLLFNAAMSWVRQYLVLHTGNRVDAVLGTRTFDHLLKLPLRYFEHRPTGVLVARLHGVETIREFVSGAAVSLLLDLPFLFVFIGIMFYYSWLLSLVTLPFSFVIAAMSVAIVPAVRERLNKQFLLGARNTAFLTEYVSGMETVKSLQMEPQLEKRFGNYLASYLEAGFRTRQLSNTYTVAANALEQLMTYSILCAGAWLVMQNTGFTVGMLVAYQMFAGRLSQPLLRLVGSMAGVPAGRHRGEAARRCHECAGGALLRRAEPLFPGVRDARGERSELPLLRPYAVSLRASEREGGGRRVRGAHRAFGQRKEHACEAHAGLLPADAWAHRSRGPATRGTWRRTSCGSTSASCRRRPGSSPAPCTRTSRSRILMRRSIRWSRPARWPRYTRRSRGCRRDTRPRSASTGSGFPAARRQRIAIARALLKRPRILIFDEATSNLDSVTAEQFARTINQLRGRVTMLFIAHQLPKALKVDQVVDLGRGSGRTEGARQCA